MASSSRPGAIGARGETAQAAGTAVEHEFETSVALADVPAPLGGGLNRFRTGKGGTVLLVTPNSLQSDM
jgi:hypothetical protein